MQSLIKSSQKMTFVELSFRASEVQHGIHLATFAVVAKWIPNSTGIMQNLKNNPSII
jgi:hypothetical protein